MTTSNEVISRADIAIADLDTNGGLLLPEQSKQFIDMIMEEPTILPQARVIRMGAPEVRINKIGFGERILRAARQAGGSLDAGGNDRYMRAVDRAAPTTSQIALRDSELIAEVHLPYELLEDNIEGPSLEAHIMRLMAQRVALDLEEWALWADTTSGDPFLALQDGWLKRATSHVADNLSTGMNSGLFSNALLALPQKYLKYLNQMKAFVSVANTIRYRTKLTERMTAYGDAAMTDTIPLMAAGLRIEGAPMLAADGIGALGLVTFPKNLLFGIRRDVKVETDKDIRSRQYIIVVTVRAALQIEDADAVIKIENV